jgi:hypothetical protein
MRSKAVVLSRAQSVLAIVDNVDGETLLLEAHAKEAGQPDLILHDQDAHIRSMERWLKASRRPQALCDLRRRT